MADPESRPKLRRTDKLRLGVGVFLASFLGLLLAGCPNSDEGNEENGRVLHGHDGPVLALAFAADGTLASAGADGTIRLWDAMAGSERTTLTGHVGRVTALAFAADGRTLVSAGEDGTVRLWDVASEQERACLCGLCYFR
jgi:WD40 repeat protein